MAATYPFGLGLAAMSTPAERPRVGDGLVASLPIALAYFPVAVSFGVAAAKAGFSLAEATFMSVIIFAGASQFLALALLAGGAAPLLTVLSLLAMNARHLLYAPALLEQVKRRAGAAPRTRWAWLWAWGLSDEVFASAIGRVAAGSLAWREGWQAGIGLGAYLAWTSGTVVGAVLGGGAFERWPAVDAALGFLMPALFVSLLLAMFERRHLPAVAAAVVGFGVGAALTTPSTGLLVGMLAGGLAGAVGGAGPQEGGAE